jgi:ADP-heptose:LPS heptosyltransferase
VDQVKVLFVHGLKLGDLLMAAPVLQFYRRKYPRAEFHLLALPEAMAASQVLDSVNVWHELPKKKILETAALASVGLLDGVDLLAACFDRLNLENFDLAVSFKSHALLRLCLVVDPCFGKTRNLFRG